MANLSILGLYNYDNTIFDKLIVPIGMDKNVLIANIIRQCSELEILWSNPETMRDMIGWWCSSELDKWQKLFETEKLEFNILDNYDRYEETTNDRNHTNNKDNNSTNTGNGTTTDYGNAYNSGTGTERAHTTNNDSVKTVSSGSETGNEKETIYSHIRGNIGVTSATQLINEYREKYATFCTYDYIVSEFKWNFCLCVY